MNIANFLRATFYKKISGGCSVALHDIMIPFCYQGSTPSFGVMRERERERERDFPRKTMDSGTPTRGYSNKEFCKILRTLLKEGL